MDLNVDENRNDTVVKILRSLPMVNAPVNFEDSLWHRINSDAFESKYREKETWWEKFLSPARLIPSAGLALAAIILLFVFNISAPENENPLFAAPKLRNEITNVAPQISNIPQKSALPPATFTASINKSGYNFLQVRLSNTEKERINRLREKIRGYFNEKSR